jgi:hypothetical protein
MGRNRCLSQDETDTYRKGVREIKREKNNDSGIIVFLVALVIWYFYLQSTIPTTISPEQMRLIRAVRGAGY